MDDEKDIELRVPPSRCIECFGKYIRTQGEEQEVCLICQRLEFKKLSKLIEAQKRDQWNRSPNILGSNGDITIIDEE